MTRNPRGDQRLAARLGELRHDIGYAVRVLRRAPAFAAVAMVTLALGIGATTAIFSVVHGVLLSPLPYPSADRIYQLEMLYPDGAAYAALSAPDFMSLREESRVLDRVEAYSGGLFTLIGDDAAKEVRGASVSDGLFGLLGLELELGRGFMPEEFVPGQGLVAVLDHGFWQREFGGDPAVLGRRVVVGGDAYEVVGVLAADARLPAWTAEIYAPLEYGETFSATTATGRRSEYLSVLARARPGATAESVAGDLREVGIALQSAFPATNERLTFRATSLRASIVGDVRTPLLVLLGAVAFVLLVACANVANLLLARASARRGELAVRTALGAGRGRLVRQLLTESTVLGLAGGAIGLVIADLGTTALVGMQAANIPRIDEIGLNGAVLLFTLGATLLSVLVFGALPAFQATAGGPAGTLRESSHGAGSTRRGHRMRDAVVVAEMALAVVLLTGAGLLIRSFVELTRVDPGFQPDRAATFRLSLQGEAYPGAAAIRQRVDEFEDRLRAMPGVTEVGATTVLPLSGLGSLLYFEVEDAPPPPPEVNREIAVASVTPGYFEAAGIPVSTGRGISHWDHDDAPPVAVINESAVRRWFDGQDPVGRFVNVSGWVAEIVGVVGDVRQRHPAQPVAPQLFAPFAQRTTRSLRFVVHSTGDPLGLAPAVRDELRALDPGLPVTDISPLQDVVAASVARPRFYTTLLALFAGVGLALAAVGIFGVMSYSVAQRSREIGIRIALGAGQGPVLRMILGRAVMLAAAGLGLGVLGALTFGRVLQSQLFGVGLFDPLTMGGVALVLLVSAAAASYLPARRAAGTDPARILREG